MISLRSKITREVLQYFFLHEEAELYLNEMARKFALDSGNLSRKLSELDSQGILKSRTRGKERFYSLNRKFPGYTGLRSFILGTLGVEEQLRQMGRESPRLDQLIIYGSYAENKLNTQSDIDVLAVGDHETMDLQKKVSGLQKKIDREINLSQMSPKDFKEKVKKDPFLKSVMGRPKINLL